MNTCVAISLFIKKARWPLFPGLLRWVEQEPPMDWVLPACRSQNSHFGFLSHCHYLTFPGSQPHVGADGQEIGWGPAVCTSARGPLYLILGKELCISSNMAEKFLPEFLNPSLESADISGLGDTGLLQKAESIRRQKASIQDLFNWSETSEVKLVTGCKIILGERLVLQI